MAMSGVRTLLLRSLRASVGPCSEMRSIRSYTSCVNISRFSAHYLPTASGFQTSSTYKGIDWPQKHMGERQDRISPLPSLVEIERCKSECTTMRSMMSSSRLLENSLLMKTILHSRCTLTPLRINEKFHRRAYSSDAGRKQDGLQDVEVPTFASSDQNTNGIGKEWVDFVNQAYQSSADAAVNAGKQAKELSDELISYIQQLYDSHPYLENVIMPVGGTLSATILAWLVMPRILRKLHAYTVQSHFSLLPKSLTQEQVPYEKSLWSALEDPARYLVTFMAFSQLAAVIAPSISQYLGQAWRGAIVLSFVWFLQRWKTNFFALAMTNQFIVGLDRDKLLTLDKLSSVGLLILGIMALAEACGVAVQSVLTVGGIGGVATAFAARDILGNFFSGLSLQFSKPFSTGDNIKAGSIEGQVVDIGFINTSLINLEKFHVIVPNSLFSSQAIVNKTRAQWRPTMTKIPIRVDDLEKIPLISEDIKSMLRSNPKVFLENDGPYCFLSRIESSFAELIIECNLRKMRKDEFYATQQEIMLQAARIIKQHGAEIGSSLHEFTGQ